MKTIYEWKKNIPDRLYNWFDHKVECLCFGFVDTETSKRSRNATKWK